jgi:enoyl-CoA hydratase
MAFTNLLVETRGRVGIITLNRPQALNALNSALNDELARAVADFDADSGIGCILLTGSEKAFAAGADIKEMAGKSAVDAFMGNFAGTWDAGAGPQAGDRRGRGVCARGRLRAGHAVRPHHRR